MATSAFPLRHSVLAAALRTLRRVPTWRMPSGHIPRRTEAFLQDACMAREMHRL